MSSLIRRWQTRNSDEAAKVLADAYPNAALHSMPRNRDNFRFSIQTVTLDRLTLGRYDNAGYQLAATNDDSLHLVLALNGGASIHEGKTKIVCQPFEVGYIIPPFGSFEIDVFRPSLSMGISVGAKSICEHALTYFGRRCLPPKTITVGNLRSPAGEALSRNMLACMNEIERLEALSLSQLAATSYSELLLNLLVLSIFDDSGDAMRTRASGSRAVEKARLFIDAFAADAIRIADIANHVGVSVRALEIGFQKSVGCSPMRYLLRRRLELARSRLVSPAPRETVTSIASDCGFVNIGLFAKRYHAVFGELPSQTLACSRLKPRRVLR